MNFETYIKVSWNTHATQTVKIALEFSKGALLVKTNEELDQFVRLVTHVIGEHLARWDEGISLLSNLKNHSAFKKGSEVETSIKRSIASLQICGDQSPDMKSFSLSDQVRVLAMAASALADKNIKKSDNILRQSLNLAKTGLDNNDPANRALAVTGNNIACVLEEKNSRTIEETELMILASHTGRKYWELAGSWLEVSRAEYRLAMTYLQASDWANAFSHAKICVKLCLENKAENLDMFYAYEAMALVEMKKDNSLGFQNAVEQAKVYFEKLSDEEKSWCEPNLKKLL